MRLIDKYNDKVAGILNYLYEFPNGVRLLWSKNPASVDFNLSVVIGGGSYYEKELGVPQGTAHFLEHVMCSPNKRFKTKAEQDAFSFGNRKRPTLYHNAYTNSSHVYYYCNGHHKGADRMLEYIYAQLDFPEESFAKYIEKERKIILGELDRLIKPERNPSVGYGRKFWGDVYPEFTEYVIGTHESIRAITVQDLIKFRDGVMTSNNTILAVQSPTLPTSAHKKVLSQIAQLFPAGPALSIADRDLNIDFKYGHFQDKNKHEIFMSLNYFYKIDPSEMNYKKDALYYFLGELLWKIGHDYLREENGLIYDPEIVNERCLGKYKVRGFSLSCSKANLPEVLEKITYMITEYWENFLHSKAGNKWFNDVVSSYIFTRNVAFSSSYAENMAVSILDGETFKYDDKLTKDAARSTTKEDLIELTRKLFSIPLAVWFTSPYTEKAITGIFLKSPLAQMYSKH